jgi:tetratricopeptide (TPR) repeat protein
MAVHDHATPRRAPRQREAAGFGFAREELLEQQRVVRHDLRGLTEAHHQQFIAHGQETRRLESHDRDTARREASLAQQADSTLPMPFYVEGLILYNENKYAEALGPLLRARDALRGRTVQMNDLNYYIGDCLARLERYTEAEPFLLEEVRVFPQNTRARAGLAMLYRAMGRDAESDRAVDEILRVAPTPEGRALAVQLWTMFGEPEKARRVRIR